MKIDRDILLLALGETLVWAGAYYIFPALLLQWESALGWSRTDLTAAITIATLASAAVSPFAGRLIDQGHGAIMMSTCTVGAGLCVALLATVETLALFYLLWLVIGMMMGGCLYDPCFSLITRARGVNAKPGIIRVTLMAGFASSLSFPIAHKLSNWLGWQSTVLIFASVVVCVAAPLIWLGASAIEKSGQAKRNEGLANKKPATGSNTHRQIFKNPVFWFLAAGFALAAVLHGATLHHLLPMLQERAVDASLAVLIVSFIGPMQVAGRLLMMSVEKYVSNHGVAVSCFVFLGAAIVFLWFSDGQEWLLFLFVVCFGGAYGTVSIIRPVIARDVLGEENFGKKSGALSLVYLIGAASAPWLGSLIWKSGGYSLMLGLLILFAIAGLGCYLAANQFSKRLNV